MHFFSIVLTLFLVQDPIGNIPVCLGLLRNIPEERRAFVIVRENLIALLISATFLISGQKILSYLQITPAGFGIAGGLILFIIAFQMIFPSSARSSAQEKTTEPFIVPLATPLLAGPSMMATVTLYANQHPTTRLLYLFALSTVSILSTVILLSAIPLYRWLGPQLLEATEKVMGVILIAIAVQMILDNLAIYFKLLTSV